MFKTILKILYPHLCLLCKKELQNSYLCDDCFNKIPLLQEQVCPACEKPSSRGETHKKCKEKTPLNGVFVAMDYKEKTAQKLIHFYKYKLIKDLGDNLQSILVKALEDNALFFETPLIIVPVPLHHLKLQSRGFNQSGVLARSIAKKFNVKSADMLERKKYTKDQKNMTNLYSRQQNIKNAFIVNDDYVLKHHRDTTIVIVDDITTTLSTLNECARTLKQLRPKKIYGIVLARGI